MQRTDARPISEYIRDFIRENHLEDGLLQCRVFNAWDEVVKELTAGAYSPEKAAALTSRKYFKDGVLSVKLNSSIVRMQFRMNSEAILNKVNARLPEPAVTRIVFS